MLTGRDSSVHKMQLRQRYIAAQGGPQKGRLSCSQHVSHISLTDQATVFLRLAGRKGYLPAYLSSWHVHALVAAVLV